MVVTTDIICDFSVVTPQGPFFTNAQANPPLFWPSPDFTSNSITLSYYPISLSSLPLPSLLSLSCSFLSLLCPISLLSPLSSPFFRFFFWKTNLYQGWEFFYSSTIFYSSVLILRNSANSSVSLNTIQFSFSYSVSFGVNQFDLIISPQNHINVNATYVVLEFPRGMIESTSMALSLDERNLIVASFGCSISTLDLSTSSPSLLSSSNLLGPAIDLAVTDTVVAVIVANHVYDHFSKDTIPSCSIQLFDIASLLLIRTIPLPTLFSPTSISSISTTMMVVGSTNQAPSLYYINLQSNTTQLVTYPSNTPSQFTDVILDSSETFAFLANSNGTLWKVQVPDLSVILAVDMTSGSITKVIIIISLFFYFLFLMIF